MYEIVLLIKEAEKTMSLYKIICHFTENKFGFQNKKIKFVVS